MIANERPLIECTTRWQMFQLLGTVTEKLWPGMSQVPGLQGVKFRHQPYNRLAQRFPTLTPNGLDLLNKCVLRRHASIALCWFRFVVLTVHRHAREPTTCIQVVVLRSRSTNLCERRLEASVL